MERVKHKVGDTFTAASTVKDLEGAPIDLDAGGFIITSAFREGGGKVHLAEVFILDQLTYPGQFQIICQTDEWPEDDELFWDIQMQRGDIILSTTSIRVVTLPDVTPSPTL